jgi:hypothetical protein
MSLASVKEIIGKARGEGRYKLVGISCLSMSLMRCLGIMAYQYLNSV